MIEPAPLDVNAENDLSRQSDMPADVREVVSLLNPEVQSALMQVRRWIFEHAASDARCGSILECLKWGEPSYLTISPKSGTTIRLNHHKAGAKEGLIDGRYLGLYVNCQTNLIARARDQFGDRVAYSKNRAILIDLNKSLPENEVRHFIALALTYHLK